MIIETIANAIITILNNTLIIEIPPLPENVLEYLNIFFEYISAGASILSNYTPLEYLLTLFMLIVSVDAGIFLYHLVMWVLRKIPLLDIS